MQNLRIELHFSANVEKTTAGFTLSLADQLAPAAGEKVTLSHGQGGMITIELVANFPDYTPQPLPAAPDNVRNSNPFGRCRRRSAGRDGRRAEYGAPCRYSHGAFSVLAFPPVANPLFPTGPPFSEARAPSPEI